MAKINRTVNGKGFEDYLIELPGTQAALRRYAFELEALAAANLAAARSHAPPGEGSFIRAYRRKPDWIVELNDELGQGAAGNIEAGRRPRIDPVTLLPEHEMVGLYVLARAIRALEDRHRSELR